MADGVPPIPRTGPVAATRPISADGGHRAAPLEPGHSYPAVVVRSLGPAGTGAGGTSAGQRYEISVFDQHFTIVSDRRLEPGTVLRVVPVGRGEESRLEIRGFYPARDPGSSGSVPTIAAGPSSLLETATSLGAGPKGAVAGAPGSPPASGHPDARGDARGAPPRQDVESVVLRTLRGAGQPISAAQLDRVVDLVASEGLAAAPAARAAARLLALGIPLLNGLLRGGARAEQGLGSTSYGESFQSLVQGARGFAATSPVVSQWVDTVTRSTDASGPGGSGAPGSTRAGDGEQAVARANSAFESSARVHPGRIQELVVRLVDSVLQSDPLLVALRTALAELTANPTSGQSVPDDLAARVRDLLRQGGSSPGGGATGPLDLDGVKASARENAAQVLRDLEIARLAEHPVLRELGPLAREVHQRADAALYLQVLEWAGLDHPEWGTVSGILGEDPRRGSLFRLTVRDQRSKGGEDAPLGFVLEVDSRTLGRVQVTGRLERTKERGADLGESRMSLRFGAETRPVVRRLNAHLSELVQALEEQGYLASADVQLVVKHVSFVDSDPAVADDTTLGVGPSHELDVRG